MIIAIPVMKLSTAYTWFVFAVRNSSIAGGFFFLFTYLWLCATPARATVLVPIVAADSVQHVPVVADTTKAVIATADTVQRVAMDTIRPLPRHGQMLAVGSLSSTSISKEALQRREYRGLADVLEQLTGVYPLSLGSAGQMNHLSFYGAMPRGVGVSYNGRPLGDPANGLFNPEQFPVEAVERVEVFTGTRAVVLGDNTVGALVNLQEVRYDTRRPFTRIWYHQGGYKHLASDGVFSQNIANGVNATVGFRRQSAKGRYENAALDAWNVRGTVRWNVNKRMNVSISDIFTNHYTGTNGGVDIASSPAIGNQRTAQVQYTLLNERVYRHDLTLAMTSYFADDSSSALSGAAYFSHALWKRGRSPELFLSPDDRGDRFSFITRRMGITGKWEQQLNTLRFVAGGLFEQISNERTPYFTDSKTAAAAAFGLVTFTPVTDVAFTSGMRFRAEGENTAFSIGVRIGVQISEQMNLWSDISRSSRLPSVVEGANLLAEDHVLLLGGGTWREGTHKVEATAFYRTVENPIEAVPVSTTTGTVLTTTFASGKPMQTVGAVVQYEGRMGNIIGTAFAHGAYAVSEGVRIATMPLLYAGFTAMYEYPVGRSTLLGGIRVRGLTAFRGMQYNPITWSYIPVQEESSIRGNGVDILVTAIVGNAFIRASYNNVFGETYYVVPFYPQDDGVFRLSVSWSFLD